MMSSYQRDIRNARREFNAKLLRGDPVTPQDVIDRYIIANKAKWESMKKMSLDIGAGQILGVPGEELIPILGRISKKDAAALLTDKFIPFTISENIERVFAENAAKLGIPNPYEAAESALDGLRNVMDELSLTEPQWPDLTELFNMAPAPAENLQSNTIRSSSNKPSSI